MSVSLITASVRPLPAYAAVCHKFAAVGPTTLSYGSYFNVNFFLPNSVPVGGFEQNGAAYRVFVSQGWLSGSTTEIVYATSFEPGTITVSGWMNVVYGC
jgi:hypothetical protein